MRKLLLPEGNHLSPLLLVKFRLMVLQLVNYRLPTYHSNLTSFLHIILKIIQTTLGYYFFFFTRLRRDVYLYRLCILVFRTEREIWIGNDDEKK